MKTSYRLIIVVALLGLALVCALGQLPQPQTSVHHHTPTMSARQEHHLLYGDDHGGGHLHGQNKSCKSEFPANWDAKKIISTVKAQAANDNLNWKNQENGYQTAENNVDGVRIRIVVSHDHDRIITAYPVNTPRNACSAR